MKTFILLMILAGHQPQFLGEYQGQEACTQAIRQIYLANIYKGEWNNPQVQAMIDTTMQYQQEYQCVPKQGK